MCPKCGTGAEAKDDDEKALFSMQCRQCAGFYHEVDLSEAFAHYKSFLLNCINS